MVDTMKELRVEANASDYATGTVLSMKDDDGKWHPCAYLSKRLNDVEQNYDVHDKELLGVMRAYIDSRSGLIIKIFSILWNQRS